MVRFFPMKIYIAGPMTGLPEFNYPAFMQAEKALVQEGFQVINPARNNGKGWNDYMRQSLRQLAEADGVFFLTGWSGSKGASLEHQIAQELGLLIRYESDLPMTGCVKDQDLQLMKLEGASTADLGREIAKTPEVLKGTGVPLHSVHDDLKKVLSWVSTHPVKLDPETGAAARRLRDLARP